MTFKKIFLAILFLDGGEGREKERERRVPGLQSRHVPWLGIEPVTPWFAGQRSIHWATPARAEMTFKYWIKHQLMNLAVAMLFLVKLGDMVLDHT